MIDETLELLNNSKAQALVHCRHNLVLHKASSIETDNVGLENKRCPGNPHELAKNQAQQRLKNRKKLPANPQDSRFWRRIVSRDETWISFRNPNKINNVFVFVSVVKGQFE